MLKIEVMRQESEKAGSQMQDTAGLSHQCSVIYWVMTTGQPPTVTILYAHALHRWYWMPQSHTWQPLSICCQNLVRSWPENSIHQKRTHAEWFSHSKCSEHLVSCWKWRNLDCESWWLFGYCDSMAENWQLKPEESWVRLPAFSLSSFYLPHNI